MRKAITVIFSVLFFCFSASAQELGYNTTDVGAEYNYYEGGNIFNIHLAFNSKLHHSIIIRAGYNAVNDKYSGIFLNEKGGGVSVGMGYRYYLALRPHQFFIGARLDYSNLNVDWNTVTLEGNYKIKSMFSGVETGYMFLINDMFFITPAVSLGREGTSGSSPNAPARSGFKVLAGLSTGIKF